jgi:hypothetical protein
MGRWDTISKQNPIHTSSAPTPTVTLHNTRTIVVFAFSHFSDSQKITLVIFSEDLIFRSEFDYFCIEDGPASRRTQERVPGSNYSGE